jgi:ribonuclease HI
MKEIVSVRFLGQCLPRNPGGIAYYAYIIRNKEGHLFHEACGLAAEPNASSSTNSVASYTALIKALEWLIKNHYSNDIIKVYGNSKLVISQINDREVDSHKNNNNNISKNTLPLYAKVVKLKSKFYYISFELTNDDDNDNKHIDDKAIVELSILAHVEARTKILEQSRNSSNSNSNDKSKHEQKKGKLFSTAAELMMAAK